jgi:hypothetical protein
MPHGTGQLIQQALLRATPWQRYLIGFSMAAGGVVFVLLGHVAGGALAIVGLLLLSRLVRDRLRRSQATTGSTPDGGRRSHDAPA